MIDAPRGRVLIDGGPDRKVLTELGRALPFGERRIDVVVATHPDADHITGLVEVLRRYDVSAFIEPGVDSQSDLDDLLRAEVKGEGAAHLIAGRGLEVRLGKEALLTVLFPNKDVSKLETNEASIVMKLVYGENEFLFTGDSTKNTEYLLLALGEEGLRADVLHVGHHGSDTSTSILYARAVSPEYAVISAGQNNRYGHPRASVLNILDKTGAKILKTFEQGTIIFETDGKNLVLK